MRETAVRSGIDWLRYTSHSAASAIEALPDIAMCAIEETIPPLQWYNQAFSLACGGRIDWNTKSSDQGYLVTITGKPLQKIRESGVSDEHLLAMIAKRGGSINRIDFAIDVHDGAETPDSFAERIDTLGQLTPQSRTRQRWSSNSGHAGKDGVTQQFGSRTSSRLLRVYDKAAEQKADANVVRYEIEVKGKRAAALAAAMSKYGVQKAGKKAMREFMKGNAPGWDEITSGAENVEIEPIRRKEGNWEKWVVDVALPNVLRALDVEVDGVRDALRAALLSNWGK